MNDIIGGFQRLEQVGEGAQARVWKAKCVADVPGIARCGDIVALKIKDVRKDANESELEALFMKLKTRVEDLKLMDHPNVVRYLGCFKAQLEGLVHVVVQEYLDGETLRERLARLRLGLDVDEGLRVIRAAAEGLEYAASKGVYHRDIKPGNIFICRDGTVKLIDFGVAKQEGATIDETGNFRGTFNYMAPDFMSESFTGDEQSDIFSLGVVLHEIISGRLPYIDSATDVQGWVARWRLWTADKAKADSPIFVHAMTLRLLNGAYEVLEKALEPSRAGRYAKFAEFRQDLGKVAFYEQKNNDRTYRRLQWIGKGGFGEVFKARWVEENVEVAVKQLLNREYARRFLTEANVMQELQDPCFVKFVDFFETPDHAFLVMKFLDGMPGNSLRDAINRAGEGGIPKPLVLAAFERYARGLKLMHRRKIIHRDIKPSNLYYPEGRPDLVAIMDFGIVRAEDNSFTSGMVPCTFDYAPPEIALTEDRGGPGMDIYALGLCMYEALTGKQGYPRIPTGTAGMMAFFERCRTMRAPNFDDPRLRDDPELLALLKKMTSPDLSKRCKDADEVATEIRKLFYRRLEDDDCPPTQVFDVDTDMTRPIDEKQLMEWFAKEWSKFHPVASEDELLAWWRTWKKEHPDASPAPRPRPLPQSGALRRWKRLGWTALTSACVSAGVIIFVPPVREALLPTPSISYPAPTSLPVVSTNATVRPLQDSEVIRLRRRIFEREMADCLADEPVETRRERLAEGTNRLEQARGEGLYEDPTRLDDLVDAFRAASLAVAGKIKNACGCDLTVDGTVLSVGEVRLFKFADGVYSNRMMRIFGYDVRPVPDGLEGRMVEVGKGDFEVSSVEVAVPELDSGVQCLFEGVVRTNGLSLKPGAYQCAYRRHGYESQSMPFNVELGRKRTFPPPAPWTPSPVDVSLPKLDDGVTVKFDGRVLADALKLVPGNYKVEYVRVGYDSQTLDFTVKLATPMTLPLPGEWMVSRVRVSVPKLPADVLCQIDGTNCTSGVELFPGVHVAVFQRPGYVNVTNSIAIRMATPVTLVAPGPDGWKPLQKIVPKPQPKHVQAEVPPEILKLLEEARFYYDDGIYAMTVQRFYEAFKKGYRLNGNDMNILTAGYKKRREWLRREIARLEGQEARNAKGLNLRNIEKYREDLRQLGEWYREVSQNGEW